MFYGSDEPETALREVAKNPECEADRYVIGEFRTLRETRILDLTGIRGIPSIFEAVQDTLEYDPRPPLVFRNYFAAELSTPIAGDRSVHVEYVPPQVVTEFVRAAPRWCCLPRRTIWWGLRVRASRRPSRNLTGGSNSWAGRSGTFPPRMWKTGTGKRRRHLNGCDMKCVW